ncbi:uncharacterized protein C17orf98-like [Physella acuta]|uniref:uncharacterized protein C17orf98-like n=1 Tax=Physella acuta TaxID=109671 RepID=UPI0027DD5164|nr:uncharacterized protein C17orf98-like [Physella acuta]
MADQDQKKKDTTPADQEEDQQKEETSKEPKDEDGKKQNKKSQNSKKSQDKKKKSQSAVIRGRENKIYRTPVTPEPPELLLKEKSFVLDCKATSSISQDYSRVNPKLGPVIPPYNSQRDKHVGNYFRFYGINKVLNKTGQIGKNASSIEGPVVDRFHERGAGYSYLSLRNEFGAGHSQETVDGHAQFMQDIRCVSGYNGKYGFRRNTPWLRQKPTPFEPAIIYPTF